MDGTAGEPTLDLGVLLRAARRRADLSQRELAARAGVPHSTVARIESGQAGDPRIRTVDRLLRAAGVALVFRDAAGCTAGDASGGNAAGKGSAGVGLCPGLDDERRDEGGRRYPAHLDLRKVRTLKDWPGAWWAEWYTLPPERWPLRVSEFTYDLNRGRRDERRLRERLGVAVRVRRVVEGVPVGCWRFVAELPGGDLVGELRAHERSEDLTYGEDLGDRREVVLDGVLVAPRLRLLGIGRRLVAVLVAETDRAGLGPLVAVTWPDGAQFLRACGFAVEFGQPLSLRLDRR